MKDENLGFGSTMLGESFNSAARPILTVDVQKYQAYLDESGLSDEQKEKFLQSLWTIVVTFVELGFGVHPLQEVCGQDFPDLAEDANRAFDTVGSNKSNTIKPSRNSGPPGGLEAE